MWLILDSRRGHGTMIKNSAKKRQISKLRKPSQYWIPINEKNNLLPYPIRSENLTHQLASQSRDRSSLASDTHSHNSQACTSDYVSTPRFLPKNRTVPLHLEPCPRRTPPRGFRRSSRPNRLWQLQVGSRGKSTRWRQGI